MQQATIFQVFISQIASKQSLVEILAQYNNTNMQLYEFGKLIGIGSFGQVFLCRHKRQDKYYVVKKLRMMELQQKQRQNIENELKLLQKLRHPNIVSYKDSFTDKDGNLCIVMVYCEAGDMYKRIISTKEKGQSFKQTQILDWISQTALAIHYLHNQKILHRDLKSQNLFLKKDQKPKDKDEKGKQQKVQKVRLGDFGIAKVLDNAQDLTSTCIGTPFYMAPEIFKYKSYSYKCDIWSFGVIIYQMCNLRLPFQAQSYQSLAVKIMKGSYPSITPTYSKQLRDLISSMLSVKPQNRPTIVDILNKPFIKKRVEKYMGDMFNRNNSVSDNDDIYLDTLRQQAISLGISLNNSTSAAGSEQDLLKKYPSSKDLERRWTRNILSRRGEEEQSQFKKQFHEKRKSLLERDSLSLQKNIRKKQDTSTSSTKALNLAYELKDEKDAFIDHKKKGMMQKQVAKKTLEDRRNLHDQVMKSQLNQQKFIQQENIRRFRMQEDYSMSDQPNESDENSINEEIIQEQSDEDLHQLTATKFNFEEEEQAPENYNKSYYKILDQIKVLKHICQTGIGTSKYLRAYKAVNNGANKTAILQILGQEFIGYWHLLDQIMFNDNILKNLSKE